jgi:L-lactate dehydrogenase
VRVAVLGAGHVGATFAFALLGSGLAREIVLVDADRRRAEGEAMDLDHAVPFGHPTRIEAGPLDACAGANVLVLTAGGAQRPGQTRLELARRNAALVQEIVPEAVRQAPDAVLVVATNPVDVMTLAALRCGGLPSHRVFGSGTILDTARLRFLLSERLGVEARSVHAHVVGEHGDSEVVAWSTATVGGVPLRDLGPMAPDLREEIARNTREAAYQIIERKGHTAYAIAAGLVRIVEAIVRDTHTVLSVSSMLDGLYGVRGVCLSLPSVVGRRGIERLLPLPLDEQEQRALRRSAEIVRRAGMDAGIG